MYRKLHLVKKQCVGGKKEKENGWGGFFGTVYTLYTKV